MSSDDFTVSPSGVRIADDFRSNLIIDRYDPVFAYMRAKKLEHLRSANSEDAVTWNVFRSLRQIAPSLWLPTLWRHAFPAITCPTGSQVVIHLWKSIPPPAGLLASGDEGQSEIDVIIEAPAWVWFLEAKYHSDISIRTKTRPERDQVLRNLDVGSYYAGSRQFFFSLLILSEADSSLGAQRVLDYADLKVPREKLKAHRPDGLRNLMAVGVLTWAAMADVLAVGSKNAPREDERVYATRAIAWLEEQRVHP